MKTDVLNAIIECNEKMLPLLNEYVKTGSVLLTLENESAEELALQIHRRNDIIDDLRVIKSELVSNISLLEPAEAASVKQMYNKEPITRRLDADMTKIQSSVLDLLSVHSDAVRMDGRLTAQFSNRNDDVHDKLQSLQQDKKKIKYYTKKLGAKRSGNYFDSVT